MSMITQGEKCVGFGPFTCLAEKKNSLPAEITRLGTPAQTSKRKGNKKEKREEHESFCRMSEMIGMAALLFNRSLIFCCI